MPPLFSIITIIYNPGLERIQKTFESVQNQTVRDSIEYLIIDGGSTDGTKNWIISHTDDIDIWVSESDSGIYDAMNKGTRLAHGEWILFLNAGDKLHSSTTLENIANILNTIHADIIYGDCIQEYPEYNVFDKASPLQRLPFQMIASHQSILCKRFLLLEHPFNLQYRVCADYDFICKIYQKNYTFYYYEAPISIVEPTGFSSSFFKKNLLEKRSIVHSYFDSKKITLYLFYTFKIISLPLFTFLKGILPSNILYNIRKRKYHNVQKK